MYVCICSTCVGGGNPKWPPNARFVICSFKVKYWNKFALYDTKSIPSYYERAKSKMAAVS